MTVAVMGQHEDSMVMDSFGTLTVSLSIFWLRYYTRALQKCLHWGKLGKGYRVSLSSISYNYKGICNYVNINF